MKNIRTLTVLIVLSLPLLYQCASTSKASEEKSEAAKTFTAPEGRGVVYLYRTGRLYLSALQYQVKINGIDAGGSGPGTFFRWELKPGTYTISSFTNESSAVAEVAVEAGKLYFFEQGVKIGLTQGGRVQIKQMDEATGKKAVEGSKMLVSAYVPE